MYLVERAVGRVIGFSDQYFVFCRGLVENVFSFSFSFYFSIRFVCWQFTNISFGNFAFGGKLLFVSHFP